MQEIHNQAKPHNGKNRISEDLKFQNFLGKDTSRPPFRGRGGVGGYLIEPPLIKTWILLSVFFFY